MTRHEWTFRSDTPTRCPPPVLHPTAAPLPISITKYDIPQSNADCILARASPAHFHCSAPLTLFQFHIRPQVPASDRPPFDEKRGRKNLVFARVRSDAPPPC